MGFIKNKFSTLLFFGFLLFTSLIMITVNANETEIEDESAFSYVIGAPNGPQNWSNLNRAWTKCGTGRMQSPIDIPLNGVVNSSSPGRVWRLYKPARAILKNRGHDIAVEWIGDAGGIIIKGTLFKLQQGHWHIPAEHTLNGARYNMELHLVHMSARGDIAVIGVFYVIGPRDYFLQRLSPFLATVNEKGTDLGFVNPLDIKFDVSSYYRYNGSLTTPPCSENIIWTLAQKVKTVSMEQVQALRDAVDDGDVGNARPIQPLNGRTICLYRSWPHFYH